ncbi:hypothetical protein N5912_10640 [Arcobacter lacus]|uniref:DUF3649 domain-containing protein n=1 Tax=Arcobacter lacus TaxID=1912876 RepID=A0ABX5JMX7_9BACT|nr:hypothetical protein [Arcobacter lacus]MCT7912285.1 hypothetical protein [Arcobacter lacus]PUE66953.1 hypothetical protein B0175_03595 [Arcobacter lacus]
MKELIQKLKTPEISGKKIGLFRTICSIFGGLFISYSVMAIFTMIIPLRLNDLALFSIIMSALLWAFLSLWISLSSSRYIALLRSVIPSIIFAIALIILYNF